MALISRILSDNPDFIVETKPAKKIAIDADGQPVSRRINWRRLEDRQIDELIGMCKMAIGDGHVDLGEAKALMSWLQQNREAADRWPANVMHNRLAEILADGKIDREEEGELIDLLMQVTGHTPRQRSYNMSRIRGKDTKPEILLRKALWKEGFRYTLKNKDIAGKPDMAFRKKKIVIFVDGCFWHRCPRHFVKPKSNADFWEKKIQSNIDRDRRINRDLKKEGWRVIRVWEHDLKRLGFTGTATKIRKALSG